MDCEFRITMKSILSDRSPLGSGTYKNSTRLFFTPSKLLEAQITEQFDQIWTIMTAIKNLRWQVRGYHEEYDLQSNSQLSSKFVPFSDKINRPNLYRTCVIESIADQEFFVAKTLLVNIFACYEGWVDNIIPMITSPNTKPSVLQQPTSNATLGYQKLLGEINANSNIEIAYNFYDLYKANSKLYNLGHLNNYLRVYRYFKECRNAIIHNGGQTTKRIVDACQDICQFTPNEIDVKEIPQYKQAGIGDPVVLTLRGVVGFSQIVLKIVSTFDIEFIKSQYAIKYFCDRLKEERVSYVCPHSGRRNKDIANLVQRAGFKKPIDSSKLDRLLIVNNVIR